MPVNSRGEGASAGAAHTVTPRFRMSQPYMFPSFSLCVVQESLPAKICLNRRLILFTPLFFLIILLPALFEVGSLQFTMSFVICDQPLGFTTVSCHKFKAPESRPDCDLPRVKDLILLSGRMGKAPSEAKGGWGFDS